MPRQHLTPALIQEKNDRILEDYIGHDLLSPKELLESQRQFQLYCNGNHSIQQCQANSDFIKIHRYERLLKERLE